MFTSAVLETDLFNHFFHSFDFHEMRVKSRCISFQIKGVIVSLDELIQRIHTDQHQRSHNKIDESLPVCIIHANDATKQRSMCDLNGDFLHSQILIDCLIKMKYDVNDKTELISLCRQQYKENSDELNIIKQFDRDYLSDYALWWYTRDSFLYKMLNKALRVQNIHLLFLFRFFIRHVEKQLKKIKCSSPVCVYRAQLMSNNEIEMLKNSLGEFISINSFFSTSFDYNKALSFFSNDDNLNDFKRVCFVIDADPRIENVKPFADISSYSFYPNEKEVLFMIGSIFQLVKMDYDSYGILIIRMRLYSFNDHQLKELFEYMQKKGINGETNLLDFANVLSSMSKWNDAEKYYQRYLNGSSHNRKDIDKCYSGLGSLANKKGDYESSLKWHFKSLEIKTRTLKPDDQSIAESYNSIGNAYEKKKDYANALNSYEKALEIFRQACGEDSLYVGTCMNNLGNTYSGMKKSPEALKFYRSALAIQKQNLPADHVNLGSSYKNIGNVLADLGHYDQALSHLNLSLEIYKKSRPSQHPSIASTLKNIGIVYKDKKDYRQALSYFEKAAGIYRHSFASTHPDVIQIENDIRYVASKLT